MTVGSLFSGIGGIDLGLERAGMRVVWQSETDEYASKVLAKHWPDVPNLGDITTITEAPPVDLICGGFPCQDISNAGKRAGIDGERSSLWYEMCRVIRLVRPRYVLVENVAALLIRGMDRVLGDLAACGYDAEWDCLPACYFGSPHLRDRVFIIAYPKCKRLEGEGASIMESADLASKPIRGQRLSKSDILRSRNDVPDFVDRIRCLGNAVVPQVAEWIGRRIVEANH